MKKNIIEFILDFIAPNQCYICEKIGDNICDDCFSAENFSFTVVDGSGLISKEFYISGREGVMRKIVDEYKFSNKKDNFRILVKILNESYGKCEVLKNENFRLVPVPSSDKHIRQRGFDHIKIIAETFCKDNQIEICSIFSRIGGSAQKGASKKVRKIQASKNYKLCGKVNKDSIYVIFDDIKTTGATINSIAEILKNNGAKEVWAIYLMKQGY